MSRLKFASAPDQSTNYRLANKLTRAEEMLAEIDRPIYENDQNDKAGLPPNPALEAEESPQ